MAPGRLARPVVRPREWGLENTGQTVRGASGAVDADIDATDAWMQTRGRGVTVGVVDTAPRLDHPDLSVVAGLGLRGRDATPSDGNGHGTHVGGTIAAAENGVGVTGVAPRRARSCRSARSTTRGRQLRHSAAAFAYAGDHGVRIVNASLGCSDFSLAGAGRDRGPPGHAVRRRGGQQRPTTSTTTTPSPRIPAGTTCRTSSASGRRTLGPPRRLLNCGAAGGRPVRARRRPSSRRRRRSAYAYIERHVDGDAPRRRRRPRCSPPPRPDADRRTSRRTSSTASTRSPGSPAAGHRPAPSTPPPRWPG